MKTLKSLGGLQIRIPTQQNGGNLQDFEEPLTVQENSAVPHCRPRTRSTVTLWNLPDSVIVHILHGIHISDLLSFRSVHPNFRDIIDNNSSLWNHVSFATSWPSEDNVHHFVKAANKWNVEASIKLAVAYLYREGLTKGDTFKMTKNAADYMCWAEKITPNTFPFFWIFIRPPWSSDGTCSKLQTFYHIQAIARKTENPDLEFGIALSLSLQQCGVPDGVNMAQEHFQIARSMGSSAAALCLLLDKGYGEEDVDKAKELDKIREMRQVASNNILDAKLHLIKGYTQGRYGGISKKMAQEYVQDLFSSSKPSGIHLTFTNGRTSDISRYILIDWLVEVVGMKDFSTHTLYSAVSMFDRFLQKRRVQRSQVQLLGVAAMVISSRVVGFDILTIREAAWLTDNSYTYHDVVRMMGELVAALAGDLRVFTIVDYLKVLVSVMNESGSSAILMEYIAMLCLLQSEMGQYSPAEIASSCMLLSRILLNHADPWPLVIQEWTGFTQDYLSLCTFHIYNKCLLEGAEVEYRETKLQAVKIRYADSKRYGVSNIEIIGHKELCRRLGVTKLVHCGKDTKAIKFRNTDELIMSPRRGMGPECHFNLPFEEEYVDRNNAATPPIKIAYAPDGGISGYDGDVEEDSDESFFDKSDLAFELVEEYDLDRSISNHTLDGSKDWDGDASLLYDSADDEANEAQVICDANTSNLQHGDINNVAEKEDRIACLSSMCHAGTNLTCLSSQSSPSSCISNCSCKRMSTSLAGDAGMNYGFFASSSLSSSSPSLSPSSSSSSSSFGHSSVQNVHMCIPCGSIDSTPRGTRWTRLGACSNTCDIPDVGKSCSHKTSEMGRFHSMRRSKSSHDVSSILPCVSNGFDFSVDSKFQLSVLPSKTNSSGFEAEIISNIPCDDDSQPSAKVEKLQNLDVNQNIYTALDSPKRSQVDICNNSPFLYNSKNTQGLLKINSSPIHLNSEASSSSHWESPNFSQRASFSSSSESQPSSTTLIQKISRRSSSLTGSSNIYVDNQPTSCLGHQVDLNQTPMGHQGLKSYHSSLQQAKDKLPVTPESVTDTQLRHRMEKSVIKSSHSFISPSANDGQPLRRTSKRARLDYSKSLETSSENPERNHGEKFKSNNCDKQNLSNVPERSVKVFQAESEWDSLSAPSIGRKRKDCL